MSTSIGTAFGTLVVFGKFCTQYRIVQKHITALHACSWKAELLICLDFSSVLKAVQIWLKRKTLGVTGVSTLSDLLYLYLESYLSQFILAASPKTISKIIHHHLHLGTLHRSFRSNCFLCRSLLNRNKLSFCCNRTD